MPEYGVYRLTQVSCFLIKISLFYSNDIKKMKHRVFSKSIEFTSLMIKI